MTAEPGHVIACAALGGSIGRCVKAMKACCRAPRSRVLESKFQTDLAPRQADHPARDTLWGWAALTRAIAGGSPACAQRAAKVQAGSHGAATHLLSTFEPHMHAPVEGERLMSRVQKRDRERMTPVLRAAAVMIIKPAPRRPQPLAARDVRLAPALIGCSPRPREPASWKRAS